jgi:hypothetical protein
MSCTSWRRAFAGNLAMASTISCNDFTNKKCVSNIRLSMASILAPDGHESTPLNTDDPRDKKTLKINVPGVA